MFVQKYIQHLNYDMFCPDQSTIQTTIGEHMSHPFKWIFTFSCLFLGTYLASPLLYFILNALLSKKKRSLDQISYQFTSSWISSLIHHAIVTPLGFYWLYVDYTKKPEQSCVTDYGQEYKEMFWVIHFVISYMTFDFLLNLKEKKYIYCFHHTLILILTFYVKSLSGPLIRFIPHFMICESSGIVFNLAWFLRTFGYGDSVLNRTMEVLFALFFFCTRILNFIPIFYCFLTVSPSPFVFVMIFPLFLLQFYWFSKIVNILGKKFFSIPL